MYINKFNSVLTTLIRILTKLISILSKLIGIYYKKYHNFCSNLTSFDNNCRENEKHVLCMLIKIMFYFHENSELNSDELALIMYCHFQTCDDAVWATETSWRHV